MKLKQKSVALFFSSDQSFSDEYSSSGLSSLVSSRVLCTALKSHSSCFDWSNHVTLCLNCEKFTYLCIVSIVWFATLVNVLFRSFKQLLKGPPVISGKQYGKYVSKFHSWGGPLSRSRWALEGLFGLTRRTSRAINLALYNVPTSSPLGPLSAHPSLKRKVVLTITWEKTLRLKLLWLSAMVTSPAALMPTPIG